MAGGWLHKGAVICPSCKEMCNEEFEQRGERCKVSEDSPPLSFYPKDELKCGSNAAVHAVNSLLLAIAVSLMAAGRLDR